MYPISRSDEVYDRIRCIQTNAYYFHKCQTDQSKCHGQIEQKMLKA